MQILFDLKLLPSEKNYFFHDESLQSYVFGLLDLFKNFHSTLLAADGTLLVVYPTGDVTLTVPSCVGYVMVRRDVYRLLSLGLSSIQQTSLHFNTEKFPNLGNSQDVIQYKFSLSYVNPLFKKKCESKFSVFLGRFNSLDPLLDMKPLSIDKDYFYYMFRPTFWQLTRYNDLYFNI